MLLLPRLGGFELLQIQWRRTPVRRYVDQPQREIAFAVAIP